LVDRKQRLPRCSRGAAAITFNEHLAHDGPAVFEHACRLRLEGIVWKRLGSPYAAAVQSLAEVEKPSEPCGASASKIGVREWLPGFASGWQRRPHQL
jgi:bifunctional non-homologous end joining protein LigD